MKINQVLVESAGATVAFAFGRFNPAHQGHIEVWRTVEQTGTNWFIGTNPSTLGPNDPLTFQQKSAWMEEIYPPISGHIVPEQSVLTLAAYIFKKLRKNERATVAYITDADDWAWSGKLLNQYNGVEGSHGYYKFAEITHVPSPRVSSATALRDAARADDKVAFYHASGTDPKSKVAGLTYFDTVKQAVEKYPLPVKRAKKVKEQVVAEGAPIVVAQAPIDVRNPKKAPQPYRNQGDIIPPTKPPSTEKRGVKGRPGQRPMPKNEQQEFTDYQRAVMEGVAESDEARIAYKLQWPELVNKVNSAMKAMGWKGQRKDDGSFMFSTQGQLDDEWYIVVIDNRGNNMFTYALGTVEEGDPHIGEQDSLPMTEASVSELMNEIREGFGLNENNQQPNNPKQDVAEVSTELRNRYVTRASDDYSNANFAARVSKDHPGLDDYSREQEQRAKKRAAGLNRALSDKRTGREQNVAEEQKTVAKTWDQMTSQEKLSGVKGRTVWNEKTRKYYTVFDVPVKQATDEASLATMRDYFAGDEKAQDPMDITKQRLYFAKDKDAKPTTKKEFRSQWDYEQWLKQNKLKPISSVKESVNAKGWTLINKSKQ